MAKLRLRFKLEAKETGLARVCQGPRSMYFWIENKKVGSIDYSDAGWRVNLMVPTDDTDDRPVNWKWARFKRAFDSRDEAKTWVRENVAAIWERAYKEKDD